MYSAIQLPPGEWEMVEFGNCIYLVSPDHPAMVIDGGEAKVLELAEASDVLFAYDSNMRLFALPDPGKLDSERR